MLRVCIVGGLGLANAARPKAPAFVEVKSTSTRPIEVLLRSGHVVRIHDSFDEDTLARLVTLLEGQPSRC